MIELLDGIVEQLAGDAYFWAVDRSEEIASKAVTYTGERLLDLVRIYTELLTRLRRARMPRCGAG